jgi:hypothetical protein
MACPLLLSIKHPFFLLLLTLFQQKINVDCHNILTMIPILSLFCVFLLLLIKVLMLLVIVLLFLVIGSYLSVTSFSEKF